MLLTEQLVQKGAATESSSFHESSLSALAGYLSAVSGAWWASVMGVCNSAHSAIFAAAGEKPRKLPKEYIQMMDKYLPDFAYHETSTEARRQTCADHWNSVFREAPNNKPNNSSSRRSTQESQGPSRITALYYTIYNFLKQNSPEFKHVFRSSLHVRSKVLVHISAGMRTILTASNFADRIEALTKTHLHFGVKPEDFDPLSESLIQSMKITSGDDWSEAIEQAWRRIYCHASILILVNIPNTNLDMGDFKDDP